MKRSLHLKTALLLLYVVACTLMLVAAHEADSAYGVDAADTTALRWRTASAFD
jgi:hypothetical protein